MDDGSSLVGGLLWGSCVVLLLLSPRNWVVLQQPPLVWFTPLEYLIIVLIKMSHSINILSVQIDTKRFKLVQQHQIVLLCNLYETEFSILYVLMLYGY